MRSKVDRNKAYPVQDALKMVKDGATAKFNESVDVSINLGIDAKKSDQTVRGSVVLPQGTGKSVRVAVFAQGDKAQQAQGRRRRYRRLRGPRQRDQGRQDGFRRGHRQPRRDARGGRLGQILGPRGLMPNPKVGTVTQDIAGAIKNAKAGQVQYRADKAGIVQCTIGRASFTVDALSENLKALVDAVNKSKPSSVKGIFLKKVSVSSTMGAGVRVDQASLTQQQQQ